MALEQSYQFPFARYPAVRILLLLIFGIITASKIFPGTNIWIMMLVPVLLLFLAVHQLSGRSLNPELTYWSKALYITLLFLSGATLFALQNKKPSSMSRDMVGTYIWDDLRFMGTVLNIRESTTGTLQLDLHITKTVLPDSLALSEIYNIRALLSPESKNRYPEIKLGDDLDLRATVYPLEEKRNPNAFDYRKYLQSLEIYHQVGIDTIYSSTSSNKTLSWHKLRQGTIDIIDANYDSETAPLAKALLIGYKQELSRDEKIAFSRVGLSHIMAVSGLHVGFLLAPFWFLIPFFWTWKYGREIGLLLLILLLIFYAGLTGFSASVTRASITGGFIMYAKLFNKVRDTVNLTALAAILILLVDPSELFQIGFQLSFGAVYIILLIAPVASRVIPGRIRYRWSGKLIMIILISIIVQAGLYPVLSFYFGEFSLIGPLANALVVPFLGIIMPYALILIPFGAGLPGAVSYLCMPVRYFLNGLQLLVSEVSAWEASWIQTAKPEPLLFLIWITGIFLIASLQVPKLRWRISILLLLLASLRAGFDFAEKLRPAPLVITIFDVGQGDAALIRTPGGKHFLIDAGRWTPGYNSGRYVIVPHLKAAGISKLEAVFLSHPHADHIGGMVDLIESIPMDTIYHSGYSYSSALYKRYQQIARKKGIPEKQLTAGTVVSIDPAMPIFVYGPDNSRKGSDPNEHSLILELHYGSTEFLFLGDAGREQEHRLIGNFRNMLNTDLLKVGHHGSNTSSSSAFLNVTTPDIAVISLAKSNKFRHPHKESVNRLGVTKSSLYFTSLEGALVFTSDGSKIHRVAWK